MMHAKRDRALTFLYAFTTAAALAAALAVSPAVLAKPDHAHKDKGLPPGLEKNVRQGKSLPPGWEKKLRVGHRLDDEIYAHARLIKSLGRDGLIDVNIDGRLLRLNEKTREIISILD